jgi:hypothetical protein
MRISETSKNQLAALWESGVPLDSAWIEFAKFFDRFAHRALCTYPANDPDVLAPDPRYNELQSWLPKTWEARQEKLLVTTGNERIHLLGEIYAGRLWAIGFRTFPDGSDELVRVPRQHFFFEGGVCGVAIHWAKGKLTVGTTTYFDIHVAQTPTDPDGRSPLACGDEQSDHSGTSSKPRKPRRSKQRTTALSKTKKHKKVGGRPSTNRRISREVRKLWDTSPEFRNLRVKQMVGQVRSVILGENRRDEETSGYRSSSMAKIIGHELTALRNRNKRNKPKKS